MRFFLLSYWSLYVYISKSTLVSVFSSNGISLLGLFTREVSGLPDSVKIECWQKSFIMGANQIFWTFLLYDPLLHGFPLSQPKNLTFFLKFCVPSEWSKNKPEIANEAPVKHTFLFLHSNAQHKTTSFISLIEFGTNGEEFDHRPVPPKGAFHGIFSSWNM